MLKDDIEAFMEVDFQYTRIASIKADSERGVYEHIIYDVKAQHDLHKAVERFNTQTYPVVRKVRRLMQPYTEDVARMRGLQC